MRIKIIGCSVTWSKENSTSFLINENLLFDVPQGSFKTLYHENDLTKTDFIIISHLNKFFNKIQDLLKKRPKSFNNYHLDKSRFFLKTYLFYRWL